MSPSATSELAPKSSWTADEDQRSPVHRPTVLLAAGVRSGAEQARRGEAVVVPLEYVRRIREAGGQPLIVSPENGLDAIDGLLEIADGLLLIGGDDVDPVHYGQPRHVETTPEPAGRDAFDLAIAERGFDRDLPVLGICRGMQVLNVALGGSLHQHLPDLVGHPRHRPHGNDPLVPIEANLRVARESLIHRAARGELHRGHSNHHQGVDRLGAGLVVSAWGLEDGVPVAIEAPQRSFALGVQWHPELDPASGIIPSFLAAATTAATLRSIEAGR